MSLLFSYPSLDDQLTQDCMPAFLVFFLSILAIFPYSFVHSARLCEAFIIVATVTTPFWLTAAYFITNMLPETVPNRWLFYLSLCAALIFLCVAVVHLLNALLDDSPKQNYELPITETAYERQLLSLRNYAYAVVPTLVPSKLSYIGQDEGFPMDDNIHVAVDMHLYNPNHLVGSLAHVSIKAGYFGIPWVSEEKILH